MSKIIDEINRSKNIAIFSHIKTDCDAVCSSLSFKLAVEQLGKKVDIFIDSNFSHQIQALPHFECINKKTLNKYDLYVCLDSATIDRLGKNKYKIMKNRAQSVQIDHHETNTKYCKINYINHGCSSTCEILYNFYKMLGVKITPTMAKLLLTGMLTDTKNFMYSNTTKETLFVASKLLDLSETTMDSICDPIFRNQTVSEFKLNKFVYENLCITENDKIAYIIIDSNDFNRLGASFDESHGLCDIGMAINTVQIMLLASEDPLQENCYHVSVRTKGDVCARTICEAFGGGGHYNAAGCKIFDTKQNITENLLNEAKRVLNDGVL